MSIKPIISWFVVEPEFTPAVLLFLLFYLAGASPRPTFSTEHYPFSVDSRDITTTVASS